MEQQEQLTFVDEQGFIVEDEKPVIESETMEQQTQQLSVIEPRAEQRAVSMWNNAEMFEMAQRTAKLLATSGIVPQAYRGKVADCVIAIDIANRMGLSPIAVMQSSQIVQGNFSWKGSACKAMIDSCGRFKQPTRYVGVGQRGTDSWGFYLEGIEKDGTVTKGPVVDIAMSKAEGWYQKTGSKWRTMPEIMLKYRAAAFFMRTECPELSMGFLTAEENEDIGAVNNRGNNNNNNKISLTDILDEEIKKEDK